jgi:hypothetical protein
MNIERVAPGLHRVMGAAVAGLLSLLAGCAGFSQVQDTVAKFDQGAHTVSTSEMAFLHAGQSADCEYQFYSTALNFVSDPSPRPAVPLVTGASCEPQVLNDQDIAIRQKLMNALVLYADQLQAIASGGADKSLATDGQSAAGDFNSFLKSDKRLKAMHTSVGADVEAAVNSLLGMVMDAEQLKDIKQAASQEAANLATVVGLLKTENTQLALNMNAKATEISLILDTTLAFIKQTGVITEATDPTRNGRYQIVRVNDYGLMFDIVQARSIIDSVNALGSAAAPAPAAPAPAAAAPAAAAAAPPAAAATASSPASKASGASAAHAAPSAAATAPATPTVVCKSGKPGAGKPGGAGKAEAAGKTDGAGEAKDAGGPNAISGPDATGGAASGAAEDADHKSDAVHQVNAALDALVAANSAIAEASSTGCLAAAVTDLITRAQAAQTLVSAINKK